MGNQTRDGQIQMKPTDSPFVAAVHHLAMSLYEGKAQPLQIRLERQRAAWNAIIAVSWDLPKAMDPGPAPPSNLEEQWPGFGKWDHVSPLMLAASRPLLAGLQCYSRDDPDAAMMWWSGRMHHWAPLAGRLMEGLIEGCLAFRDKPKKITDDRAHRYLVSETAGQLGIRFECLGLGLLVRELHPNSPATMLKPGDVILSVDGEQLTAMDLEVAGAQLAGPVGKVRKHEVYRDGETLMLRWAATDSLESAS